MQTLILVRHTLWVGFSCLSIKPYCALEDALGELTWACICPEGHEVLSHLSASRRHFHMPRGSWNATGHLCLHNWISPAVRHCTLCKGWEKVSWWGFFDRKFYLFFCVVCAFPVGRIPNERLVVQLVAHTHPARGERSIFQPVSQQQLIPVTPMLCCTLLPLTKACVYNGITHCLEDDFHCLWILLFARKKQNRSN